MEFKDILKSKRKARNLSQQALANELGISEKNISRWESGENLPDVYNLTLLSLYFQTPADLFLSGNKRQISEANPDLFPFPPKEDTTMNKNTPLNAFTYSYSHQYNTYINPVLYKTADNLFKDFTVAFDEEFIEAMKFFVAQQMILTELLKQTSVSEYAEMLSQLGNIDFFGLFEQYCKHSAEFREAVKTFETSTFKEKFAAAEPIISVLRSYMKAAGDFNNIVSRLMKISIR